MIFSFDLRRARKGDCFLIHSGSKDDPGLVIVDGGPKQVYTPHLQPRITAIRQARPLTELQPLTVDALMVSHVDDDHIQGVIELVSELKQRHTGNKPMAVRVKHLWHNSFDAVIDDDAGKVKKKLKPGNGVVTASATIDGELPDDLVLDSDAAIIDNDPVTLRATLQVLASVEQGHTLRSLAVGYFRAKQLGFEDPSAYKNKPVIAQPGAPPLKVAPGLTFRVIGPLQKELDALRKKHQEWLRDRAESGDPVSDVLAAYADTSPANLSSLVVLAEAAGKKMLLTGDARGDKILEGLEFTQLVPKGGTLKLGLLKVPHHGSARNLEQKFFERLPADHYVFSGNGEHGNPDREALEMLIAARGETGYAVHLTYPVDEIDAGREADWNKERAKEKKRKEKRPGTKVRGPWSAEKHSLAALLAKHPKFAKLIREVKDDKKGYVIDLGTPLKQAWPTLG